MKRDIQSAEDVRLLVDTFYTKVNSDPLLSPVFNQYAQINWETHLPKMVQFWSSILLDSNEYRGQPFEKHAKHAMQISGEHFDRWLNLFEETLNELFIGEKADLALTRAKNIGAIFNYKLDLIRNNKE